MSLLRQTREDRDELWSLVDEPGSLDLRRGYATSCPPRQVNDSNKGSYFVVYYCSPAEELVYVVYM